MVRGSPLGQFSPRRTWAAMAGIGAAVVAAEVSFVLLERFLPPSTVLRAAADCALDILFIAPAIWWCLFQPLQEWEATLRGFFNDAPVGLYRSTIEGRLTLANRTLVRLLGYPSARELFGADLSTAIYVTPEERARVTDIAGRSDTFGPIAAHWKRYDGAPLTVALSGRTLRDAGGHVVGFEGAVENITDRSVTQERLELVQRALDAAANAIVITSRHGAIEWVNDGFTRVTGHTLSDVAGMTPRVLKSGRTPAATYEELWAAITAGQTWSGELVNRRRDGSFYHQDLTVTPVLDAAGQVSHFIGVGQDTSERHRLEAQLRQAQKMEAVGQLTGGIAHDFNNILAVILANADLLAAAAPPTDPASLDDLADIKAAAARGAGMVRKLLGFSRLAELQLLPIDLGETVQGMTSLLRRVLPESVEISVRAEKNLPPVRADLGAVEQILLNLATNARDAMPNGGRLEIAVEPHDLLEDDRTEHPWVAPGEYVCIAVTDSGHGMDADTRRRIFDPFFTTKPPGKGTGLGMPMIYGLTKQQGGFVHVYSEVGKGTTIRVYFPRLPDAVAITLSTATPAQPRPGRGETVLLVEDEEALRRTGRRILERLGYRVLLAADGVEGLELYRANRDSVAVIISDLVMPRMGGHELYRAIRHLGTVPFILASGYAATELRASGVLDESVRHLPKPWALAEVAEAVRDAIDGPRARAS